MTFESISVTQALNTQVSVELEKGFFCNLSGLSVDLQSANPERLSSLCLQLRDMLTGKHKKQLAKLIKSTGITVQSWPDDLTTIDGSTLPKLVAGLVAVLEIVQLVQRGKAEAEECRPKSVVWLRQR